jgi:UDP-N-acetylglucosamine acyltransferase
MPIHPTALADPSARVAESADVGPGCVIGPEVEIGARTRLMAHVYVEGPTWIGEDSIFFPFSTVGVASQDLKYQGERAETRIGNRNRIREFVTIHRGTQGGGLVTSIGDDNCLMAYVHVAHDVRIGSHTILGNGATIGPSSAPSAVCISSAGSGGTPSSAATAWSPRTSCLFR